jgi:hypothetical protein
MDMDLKTFLSQVTGHVSPKKEPTMFSVGGHGYYENAASDLLAFFLKPHAEHGLNDLFLSTLLGCMGEDHNRLRTNGVYVDREVLTEDGSRIDLEIRGRDWCLLVENKIYHHQNNPFGSYEAHARTRRKQTLFAILSPDGISQRNGWVGVSYKNYCKRLREGLGTTLFESNFSKWHLFAREFILHMETELYTAPITTEQAIYVEQHLDGISAAKRLEEQYRDFLRQQLLVKLTAAVPTITFDLVYDRWPDHVLVLRCKSPQWKNSDVVLLRKDGAGQKFFVRTYVETVSEERLTKAKKTLAHMQATLGGPYPFWDSCEGDETSHDAISEVCKLAQVLNELLKD